MDLREECKQGMAVATASAHHDWLGQTIPLHSRCEDIAPQQTIPGYSKLWQGGWSAVRTCVPSTAASQVMMDLGSLLKSARVTVPLQDATGSSRTNQNCSQHHTQCRPSRRSSYWQEARVSEAPPCGPLLPHQCARTLHSQLTLR
jgi:hypothetical protein